MHRLFSVLLIIIASLIYTKSSPLYLHTVNNYDENLSDNSTLADAENYRLPNNTIPLHYDVELFTDVHKSVFTFMGKVKIKLEVVEQETDSIVVHYRQLKNFKVKLVDSDDNNIDIDSVTPNIVTEFLTIKLANGKKLIMSTVYYLTIEYDGELRKDNGGFYLSEYKSGDKTIYLATTQFESTDARHGFPCYDEPGIKSEFTISIKHGSNFTALSNMPIDKNISDGSYTTTKFKTTPRMSTYLVAFVVSNFKGTSLNSNNHPEFVQRVFSRPNAIEDQSFALKTGVKVLDSFEKYLHVDYSLPKMDQIAIPDFAAGAMENWGLVTYREEALLYNKNHSTIYSQTSISNIISHEFGHQWFGNLVSPKWWTYLWLNEGFASLFAYLGTNMVYPEWKVMDYFITSEYHSALSADGNAKARPMTHYVQKPNEIIRLFDVVSYSKAACVLRMMQHVLTEKNFELALTDYLIKMKYSVAVEEDLFESFQKIVDEQGIKLPGTITEILSSWTRQGGYPLLNVERNYDDGSFKITQKGYGGTKDDKRKWWIPYNFANAANPDFTSTNLADFIKDESTTVQASLKKGDWLILNKQLTGYYRVNYDKQNWRLIISELRKNHKNIHSHNRAQLIFDAIDFTVTKELDFKTLLKVLSYLENEEEYAPWNSAHKILTYLNRILGGDEDYESFQYFIKTIITNIYNKLGISDKDKEHHFDKYTRLIAIQWACAAGMESCLMSTNLKLKDLVENNKPIEPNLLSSVYCNGLKTAGEKEFNFLYNKLMKSEDQAERKLIISTLGCSGNVNLLRKFADTSISKTPDVTLRTQERIIVLQSIYTKGPTGLLTAIDFLNEKYNEYADLTPGFGGANPLNIDLAELSKLVVNENQKEKMMSLVQKAKSHPEVDKNMEEKVAQNIKSNLDWIKENRDSIFVAVNKFKPSYRLPNNTIPLHYDVNLFTDVHKSLFNFTGEVTITLKAITEPSDNITIHYRQLQIDEAELTDSKQQKIETQLKLNKDMELITVNLLKEDLIPNTIYKLKIKYKGELRSDNGGFYRSKSSTNGNLNYIATTQFESTDARHGFPCYDEPGLKANFTIKIKHGKNYTALSNMPGDPVEDGDYVITTFGTTPKMSTYLIAIIVSNFEGSSGSLENNKLFVQRVFSRPETKGEQKFALDSGLSILDGMEKYLAVKYSLPKMDQVAVPDFAAGAMENWGLVTYREELLLYNPNKSTINTKTSIATTIAHEYGHQWFGNLVSPKWWTYIWLNEGFASLFAYLGSDVVYPEWNLMEYFIVNEYQKALMNDAGKNPRPMTHYVDTPKDIARLFDVVSYSKAASVLRMVQHSLTEKVFKNALTNYLNKMQYEAATENDLFEAFRITAKEENFAIHLEMKDFMGSWTSQGGYPLLTVDRQYKDGTFSVKQEGFSISPEENKKDERLWYIPYNYVRSKDANFSQTTPDGYLKKEREIQVKPNEKLADSEWIILNKQTTGYYRVNYDEQNWKLIISTLKNDHNKIHVYNRAQLLSDSHHLTLTKRMKLDLFFDLLIYLEKEESYATWAISNTIFNYYNEFLRGHKEYESFQFFIKTTVKKIYEKLGINEKKEDSHFDKYTRTTVINLACTAGIEDCLKNTNQKIKDLVEKNQEIAPNLQTAIYCNGLKKANDEEFNYMYNRLMKSDNQAERQLLMSSLGCTENGEQIKKFVESSLNNDNQVTLRPQERINVLKSAYTRGQSGLYASIEFLKNNFAEYAKLTPGFGGANPLDVTIKGMSSSVVNDQQKTKMLELLDKVKNHPDVDINLEQIVKSSIDKNLDWIHANDKNIFSWMNSFKKDRTKDDDKDKDKDNSGNHTAISFMTLIMSVVLGMRFIF